MSRLNSASQVGSGWAPGVRVACQMKCRLWKPNKRRTRFLINRCKPFSGWAMAQSQRHRRQVPWGARRLSISAASRCRRSADSSSPDGATSRRSRLAPPGLCAGLRDRGCPAMSAVRRRCAGRPARAATDSVRTTGLRSVRCNRPCDTSATASGSSGAGSMPCAMSNGWPMACASRVLPKIRAWP